MGAGRMFLHGGCWGRISEHPSWSNSIGFSDVVEESQGADTNVAENYNNWVLPDEKPRSPCCDGLMQSVNDF